MINPKNHEHGLALHGHKCPAMPMGLRVGAAAMKALGVDRAKDGQLLLVALGLTALVVGPILGCSAHTAAETSAPAVAMAAIPDEMPPCPLAVPETTSSVRDTADGITVDIVTTGSVAEVREVRSRMVGRLAYGKTHPRPMPVPMTKETEEIPGGIRMIVHSVDPARVDEVRTAVRKQLAAQQAEVEKLGGTTATGASTK